MNLRITIIALIVLGLQPMLAHTSGAPPASVPPKNPFHYDNIKGNEHAKSFAFECARGSVAFVSKVLESNNLKLINDSLQRIKYRDNWTEEPGSAIGFAAHNGHVAVIRVLLDFASRYPVFQSTIFANDSEYEGEEYNALYEAIRKNQVETVRFLLEYVVKHPQLIGRIFDISLSGAFSDMDLRIEPGPEVVRLYLELARDKAHLRARILNTSRQPLLVAATLAYPSPVGAILDFVLENPNFFVSHPELKEWIFGIDEDGWDPLAACARRYGFEELASLAVKHPEFVNLIVRRSALGKTALHKLNEDLDFDETFGRRYGRFLQSPLAPLVLVNLHLLTFEENGGERFLKLMEYAPLALIPQLVSLLDTVPALQAVNFGRLEAAVVTYDLAAVLRLLNNGANLYCDLDDEEEVIDDNSVPVFLLATMLKNNREWDRLEGLSRFVRLLKAKDDARLNKIIEIIDNYLKATELPVWITSAKRYSSNPALAFMGFPARVQGVQAVNARPGLWLFANSLEQYESFVAAENHARKLAAWFEEHGNFDMPLQPAAHVQAPFIVNHNRADEQEPEQKRARTDEDDANLRAELTREVIAGAPLLDRNEIEARVEEMMAPAPIEATPMDFDWGDEFLATGNDNNAPLTTEELINQGLRDSPNRFLFGD